MNGVLVLDEDVEARSLGGEEALRIDPQRLLSGVANLRLAQDDEFIPALGGEAVGLEVPDQGETDCAVLGDAQLPGEVGVLVDGDGDEVAGAEDLALRGTRHRRRQGGGEDGKRQVTGED